MIRLRELPAEDQQMIERLAHPRPALTLRWLEGARGSESLLAH